MGDTRQLFVGRPLAILDLIIPVAISLQRIVYGFLLGETQDLIDKERVGGIFVGLLRGLRVEASGRFVMIEWKSSIILLLYHQIYLSFG